MNNATTSRRVETTGNMRKVLVAALSDPDGYVKSKHLPTKGVFRRGGAAGYGSAIAGLVERGYVKNDYLTPAGVEKAKAIRAAMNGDEWWANGLVIAK